jgi:poly(3-hydroxybutyrate) depolymerase
MEGLPHPRRSPWWAVGAIAIGAAACSSEAAPPPTLAGARASDDASSGAPPPAETTPPPAAQGWTPPALPTRSPGCGAPQAAIRGATHKTTGGRTFHVWGPPAYEPARAYPVVVAYHGWYSNGRDHQSWFEMEKFVEDEALVVYPDADGPTWDISGERDLVAFDGMMKTLGDAYCIDPSRVLAFGFSFGGKFVNHLGCKRAGYVKAISVGDGSWGGDGKACGRLPVLVTHRTRDNDELIAWGRAARDKWTRLDGCASERDVSNAEMRCETQRSCDAPGSVTFCEDTFFDASWPEEWNHTVRESYRLLTWRWFKAL